MSLIEQAAKRLEELRRAGVDVPQVSHGPRGVPSPPPVASDGGAALSKVPPPVERKTTPPRVVIATKSERPTGHGATHPPQSVHLDLAHLAANGIVTPDVPRSQQADEFRIVKRPLLVNATGKGAAPVKNGNLIMVTSAMPGEGKSFTAVNLAMSIAMELDHTVLLVDADVARPSLPRMLNLTPTRGLLDVLVDESVDLGDVLLKTNVEKLSILLSGTQHPRATELLASGTMNRLLEELARRYADRIIIFDSPPLLVTTEARELATHMGQVVIVVEAQQTARTAVRQALATLESCPVKMMVLNKSRSVSGGGSYGYGYGYGYGH